MKKVSMFGLSLLTAIAITTVMFFNACTSDPCKDVACGLNGACVDGNCVCDAGFEGTSCETEVRTKFIGTYKVSGTVSCPVSGNGTFSDELLSVSTSSAGIDKIVITFVGAGIVASVAGTGLTIESQTLNGFTYTGNGSINGTNITMTLNEFDPTLNETCVYSFTGPKQ